MRKEVIKTMIGSRVIITSKGEGWARITEILPAQKDHSELIPPRPLG